MKAAVISEIGNAPVVAEFRDPPPTFGVQVGHLLAASLNPVDLTIAAGKMPHRPVEPPFVAGFEGVARLDSGQVVYLAGPPEPFGTLAELIPVPDDHAIPVPDGLDPVLASSLGVAGLAAWLSLDYRGSLQPGESVLILGAGTVGLIAVQAAKAMGAERVVIADVRTEALQTAARKGADATVNLSGLDTGAMREAFASAAPQGFDLVLDLVWGDAVNAAIDAAKMHARVVQTGNAASPTVQLPAAVFRNKHISIIGQSIFVAPIEVRRTAYTALAQAALGGAISLDTTSTPLDEADAAWRRLGEGAPEKQIIVP
jgi:NADPH:quinone reductase-like Zn-dependent oxidoreductase